MFLYHGRKKMSFVRYGCLKDVSKRIAAPKTCFISWTQQYVFGTLWMSKRHLFHAGDVLERLKFKNN